MADDAPKPLISHEPAVVFAEIFMLAVLLTAIIGFINRIIAHIQQANFFTALARAFEEVYPLLQIASAIISTILIVGLIYFSRKLGKLRAEERKRLNITQTEKPEGTVNEPQINLRWQAIQKHLASSNQNDWRQAIIDADIMLDEMLTHMGYTGDTIGDKLKGVEKSDFLSLDEAWEAHKVRNRIAHEGAEFLMNQREARRVVDMYRKVFEEFKLI